ncbi:MAG: pentapeptide repeat-containing protein [Planctomycetaceae bacterium]|nr:pentapeptide repeat-containing protein [Planctomycetaceae bacterium]
MRFFGFGFSSLFARNIVCILDNCIFANCIFANCIFANCIFANCIFANCIFANCIFANNVLWIIVRRIFHGHGLPLVIELDEIDYEICNGFTNPNP